MFANQTKAHFQEQRLAAGLGASALDKLLEETAFTGEELPCVKGFGHRLLFSSPWATSYDDEHFFTDDNHELAWPMSFN